MAKPMRLFTTDSTSGKRERIDDGVVRVLVCVAMSRRELEREAVVGLQQAECWSH